MFLAILGISWFWLYGALLLAQFPAYARNVLGGGEGSVTWLLSSFTIGTGLGALACARLSGGRVRRGLVAAGALGLAVSGLALWRMHPSAQCAAACTVATVSWAAGVMPVLLCLLAIGFSGALFVVPLCALMQERARPRLRAREDAALLGQAHAQIEAALAAGELVAIFPEGALTRGGGVGAFRPGIARILRRSPVPVVPLALSGLWGSLFSYRHGSLWARLGRLRLFRRIRVRVGCPVPPQLAQPDVLRAQVLALRGPRP